MMNRLNLCKTKKILNHTFLLSLLGFSGLGWGQSPGGVTGTALWLRADQGVSTTVDGAGISQWNDQSGNGRNALAAVFNGPTYRISENNYNPSIYFTRSASQFFTLPSGFADFTAGATIYVVGKPVSSPSWGRFIELGNGLDSDNILFARFLSSSDLALSVRNGSTAIELYASYAILNNVNSIYGGSFASGAAASSVTGKLYKDGLQATSGSLKVPNNLTRNTNYIGKSSWSLDGYYDGSISEVIIYQGDKSSLRNKIESYLSLKYGITLDQSSAQNYVFSNNTVIWNSTSNAGYNNNIAGISRDDASSLHQRQSVSANSGIQPVIGNVTIASSNIANPNPITADNSALLWGSDLGSTSFSTPFVFGNSTVRIGRIWKVQETGTIGIVKVALPANTFSSYFTPTLVVSNDNTFNGSDLFKPMTLETLGGVSYYTATIDFTSNQFFTFSASNVALATHDTKILNEENNIYPNPADSEVHILNYNKVKSVTLYDFSGKIIDGIKLDKDFIDIKALPTGKYVLKMLMTDGSFVTENLIKK